MIKRVIDDYFLLRDKYDTVGVFLYGSQNYGLETPESDIDTKAIVLPSLKEVFLGKEMVSKTLDLPNNEKLDVKDIRLMFRSYLKQNVNFIETLFTDYFIINPSYEKIFNEVLNNREDIAYYNPVSALNCMLGMAKEKFFALRKPFPSKIEVLNTFGYDPKQLHHIIRLEELMGRYIQRDEEYKQILKSNKKDYLKAVKAGFHPNDAVDEIAEKYIKSMSDMRDTAALESSNKDFVEGLFESTILALFERKCKDDYGNFFI